MSKDTALSWIDENEKKIIEMSDKAWEYAELVLLEYRTSKLLADEIEGHGFKVVRGIAEMPTASRQSGAVVARPWASWGSWTPSPGSIITR